MKRFLIVVDFEAVCDEPVEVEFKEIIEWPGVVIDTQLKKIVSTFHEYVKPQKTPILPKFTTELTGITQEMVDGASPFPQVYERFVEFCQEHTPYSIVCDSPFDFGYFLPLELESRDMKIPSEFRRWVNICDYFRNEYKFTRGTGLAQMLKFLKMEFEGNRHSGIDDAKNIARVALNLLSRRVLLAPNQFLEAVRPYCERKQQEFKERSLASALAKLQVASASASAPAPAPAPSKVGSLADAKQTPEKPEANQHANEESKANKEHDGDDGKKEGANQEEGEGDEEGDEDGGEGKDQEDGEDARKRRKRRKKGGKKNRK